MPPPGALDGDGDEFNWRLAVALAGCSFEAYLDVDTTGDAGIKEQALQRGSEVTYVDDEFLTTKMGGLLDVYVKGCTGLPAVEVRRR